MDTDEERFEGEGGAPRPDVDPEPAEELESENEWTGPNVTLGPHPLGGIQITARQFDGTIAQARINLEEAAMVAAHLNALITMGFNAIYAQQYKEARTAQDIYVPRR